MQEGESHVTGKRPQQIKSSMESLNMQPATQEQGDENEEQWG